MAETEKEVHYERGNNFSPILAVVLILVVIFLLLFFFTGFGNLFQGGGGVNVPSEVDVNVNEGQGVE